MRPTVSDLFVLGIGVELVGAWLLARGLLASPTVLKSFSTVGAIGVGDVVDRARNRVDAAFGVVYLLIGFLAQLGGYLLQIAGRHGSHGARQLETVLVILALAAGLAWLLWRCLHPYLFKLLLVRIAFAPVRSGEVDFPASEAESLELLARYGKAAKWQGLMYEGDESYVARVFGDPSRILARRWWKPHTWR